MVIKRTLRRLHQFMSGQLGLDLRRLLRSLRGIPRFIKDWIQFRRGYAGRFLLAPCLFDWYEEGGITKDEYFWQDLLVAGWIHTDCPERHVDIGSRVDGFVAHVASFRKIEVFDVRPITTKVPGVVFRQADLMSFDSTQAFLGDYCDSLSCLHAIEHFGLGRYGDPVDTRGYERGLANMAQLLRPGGTFYLSTPIGQERVAFNANWVFDPRTIMRSAMANGLELQKLTIVSSVTEPYEVAWDEKILNELVSSYYNLGIFVFKKRFITE